MIELTTTKFSKALKYFDKDTINYPIVMSVIENRCPGKIWVNEIENPSVCLVITNAPYSFIGTLIEVDTALLLDIIDILKLNKPVKLIWQPGLLPYTPFKNAGFAPVERIQFHNPAILQGDTSLIDAICEKLPRGFEVKGIDVTLLRESNWFSYIKLFYGREESFLKTGFGLALVKSDELVSEAFACFIGGDAIETGSVTTEKYRGRGYATLIRAFLIKEGLRRGLQSITSCDLNNIASAKASKKLGYIEEVRYQFLTL